MDWKIMRVNLDDLDDGIAALFYGGNWWDLKGIRKVCLVNIMEREKLISSEVSIDPFYSEENQEYLKKVIDDIDSGRTKLEEHDLIEEWID